MSTIPTILYGLDFTRPATDLIDEVLDRLMARYQEDNPGKAIGEERYTAFLEEADRLVMSRLV